MANKFAVLTGDLINSTALSAFQVDAAMTRLDAATREASGWANGAITGFRTRGGDGWQAALSAPEFALRLALIMTAQLRHTEDGIATRVAIATGTGTLPDDGDTNRAHGPAFVASGRLLEGLDKQVRIAHASGGTMAAATRLADHIAQGWTQAQARAMAEALVPGAPPRATIAEHLGITRQAVNQALWSGGFPAIDEALSLIEGE